MIITGSAQSDFMSIIAAAHLSRMLFGQEPPMPPAVVPQDPAALAKLAGTYEVPGGGRLVVTAGPARPGRAAGLTITPEGREAFAALAGASPADRERYAALEARSMSSLEAARKGNFELLHELYGKPRPLEELAAELKGEWASLEQELGPFRRFEALGTGPLVGGGRVVTWVRLVFERGTRILTQTWRGPEVVLVQVVPEATGPVFLPVGPRELAAFDLRSGTVSRVTFETGEGGAAALVIGGTRAKRGG